MSPAAAAAASDSAIAIDLADLPADARCAHCSHGLDWHTRVGTTREWRCNAMALDGGPGHCSCPAFEIARRCHLCAQPMDAQGRPPVPNVCTLVGPTRHRLAFDHTAYMLGRCGWLVFSVGSHLADDRALKTTEAERAVYHRTHRQKIMRSHLVVVVDLPYPGAPLDESYYGQDTAAEIEFARAAGVKIRYLSNMPAVSVPVPEGSWPEVEAVRKESMAPPWSGELPAAAAAAASAD